MTELVLRPRSCRVCGCTDDRACVGGCWWIEDPEGGSLCSACRAGVPLEAVVVCPAYASSCHCGLPPGHDGPHECVDQERCGGQWTGSDATHDVVPVRFPSAGGRGDAVNALFGLEGWAAP